MVVLSKGPVSVVTQLWKFLWPKCWHLEVVSNLHRAENMAKPSDSTGPPGNIGMADTLNSQGKRP